MTEIEELELEVLKESNRLALAAIKAEQEAAHKEVNEAKNKLKAAKTESAIRDLVQPEEWACEKAKRDAAKLLAEQLELEGEGLTVHDGKGNPLIGPHGLMRPQELLMNFRAEHPEFTKRAHTPATKTTADPQTSDEHLRRLFSSKAEGKYAQAFFAKSPTKYRQLRALAIERGIR